MSSNYIQRVTVIIIFLTCVWLPADAVENSAPFGLAWGASLEELRVLGIDLQAMPSKEYGEGFVAQKLPKALSDQESALLFFGFDDKLWRVVAISRKFENDPQGAAVKARYQELLTSLTDKYGKPQSVHSLGDSIFSQPAYFISGIRDGRSFWYSNLANADVKVQIAIHGESNDIGRWTIYYESVSLKRAFDESKRAKEKNAL
jgi:hypothetical protein